MRISDFFLVLPTFVLALILAPVILEIVGDDAEVLGIRATLFVIIVVIGLTSWATTARIIRSQVLSLKERMFVDRARAIGAGPARIMRRHILPNVVNLIVAQAVLTFAAAVFTETTLSFVGLGDPFAPSWGQILDSAQVSGAPGPRRVVVHRAAGRLRRARRARLHAGRQRPRRHPQSEAERTAMTADRAPSGGPPSTAGAQQPAEVRGRRQWPLPKQAVPGAPLLEVEDLKTYFQLSSGVVHAVDGVTFKLDYGEALGIAGESGCGKTTTALSLVRLLPSNARIEGGSIKLFGIDLVPEDRAPAATLSLARDQHRLPGRDERAQPGPARSRPDRRADRAAPVAVARRVAATEPASCSTWSGIPKKRGAAYPHELSGGMRQRAMIAMALACDPAIIIGDEPTTALDVMVQAQILALLERLRDELNLSLILITHDLSVIAETCDRVLIMYAGRVAEEGSVREVFARPRHPYTQKLLSAFPNIQADRRTLDVIPGSPPDLRTPPPGLPVPSALRLRDAGLLGGRAARGHPRRWRPDGLSPLPGRHRRRPGHGAAAERRRPDRAARSRPRRRRATRAARGGRLMADDLLRLENLQVHFPIRGGLARHDPAPARAASSVRSTGST